jgi:hypothetical protein
VCWYNYISHCLELFSFAGTVCKQGVGSCEYAALSFIDDILIYVAISGDRNVIKKGLDKIL